MSTNGSSQGAGIHRRDFLALGATAVAAGAATSVSGGTYGPFFAPGAAAGPVLSVGFSPKPDGDELRRIVPAEALRFADSQFGHGARLTVRGLTRVNRGSSRDGNPVSVLAYYGEADRSHPFVAWSGVSGAPVTFTLPVDANGRLALGFERKSRGAFAKPSPRLSAMFGQVARASVDELPKQPELAAARALCLFSANGSSGINLRRGTYFVALRKHGSESQPRWDGLTVTPEGLRGGLAPLTFDYLTIDVDYA